MLKSKLVLLSLTVIAMVAGFNLMSSRPVSALLGVQGAKNAACQGVDASSSGGCNQNELTDANKSVSSALRTVLNILSIIVGFAAVITVVISGLRMILSQGDPASVNTARNAIIYALVGVVIVSLAQIIVRFVLDKIK